MDGADEGNRTPAVAMARLRSTIKPRLLIVLNIANVSVKNKIQKSVLLYQANYKNR